MGVDITNDNDAQMHFNHFVWARLLGLARDYGWQSRGTVLGEGHPHADHQEDPENEPWDGNYSTNSGQTVTAEDAHAFADALEKALDDIPDHRINSGVILDAAELTKLAERTDDPLVGVLALYAEAGARIPKETVNPLEYFAGEAKQYIKELIRFCREGAFSIC